MPYTMHNECSILVTCSLFRTHQSFWRHLVIVPHHLTIHPFYHERLQRAVDRLEHEEQKCIHNTCICMAVISNVPSKYVPWKKQAPVKIQPNHISYKRLIMSFNKK